MPHHLRHLMVRTVTIALALTIAGSASATDIERRARELDAMLIAPCCFTQPVSIHHSAAADEVRQDVRRRLTAGQTQDEILHAYVERYGKRILAEPPAEGFDRLLYVLPPLGLFMTAALVVMVVRRLTRRSSPAATADGDHATSADDDRYRRELDDQLRDLD